MQKERLKDFDWDNKNEAYIALTVDEIETQGIYDRFFAVEEGDVVVDIGASIGPFTYSILGNRPKKCVAVEPLSGQFGALVRNLKRDEFGKFNVIAIQAAITDKKVQTIHWDGVEERVPTLTFEEFILQNNLYHIDFLKCDCEGGEYEIFSKENIDFLKRIPKMVVEFHLSDDDNFNLHKFKRFRDTILQEFEDYKVYSVDGVDIKWDLFNDHFLEYYKEVIFYFDNRDLH